MITLPSDLARLPVVTQASPATPNPTAQPITPPPVATTPAPSLNVRTEAILNTLLPPDDGPQASATTANVSRMYAESAATSRPTPPSSIILAAAAQATGSRPAAPILTPSAQPTTAQPQTPLPVAVGLPADPALSLLLDGKTYQLTPAQLIAVRIAIGAMPRRVDNGTVSGEMEAPSGSNPTDEADEPLIRTTGEIGGANLTTEDFKSSRAEATRTVAAGYRHSENEQPIRARDETWTPAPVETLTGLRPDTGLIAPVQHPVPYHAVQEDTAAVSGIVVSFAAGVTYSDVSISKLSDRFTIAVAGSDDIVIGAPEASRIRLVFADGSVHRLDRTI